MKFEEKQSPIQNRMDHLETFECLQIGTQSVQFV